jgi:hypothetical protein
VFIIAETIARRPVARFTTMAICISLLTSITVTTTCTRTGGGSVARPFVWFNAHFERLVHAV